MELGLLPELEEQTTRLFGEPELRKGLDQHLQKTRQHVELLGNYLQGKGVNLSSIRPKDPVTKTLIHPNGGHPNTARQTELIDYVTEAFEVASYRALSSLAHMVGDNEAGKVFERILGDEIAIANELDKRLPGHNGSMGAEGAPVHDNVAIVRQAFAALNDHDLEGFVQLLAADFRGEMPGIEGAVDREQTLAMMKDGFKAFPDQRFDVQRIIAAGDDVIAEWISTATNLGPIPDPTGAESPATGRRIRFRGSSAFCFKDGKIAEERDFFDIDEINRQLGVTPGPEQTSPTASGSSMRGLVHLEIPAADRSTAAAFYREMFSWEFEHQPEEFRYTTFKTGNIAGGFAELASGYMPGDVTFYVGSEDIESDLRRAEKLGGKTLVPRTEIPGMGWFAIIADPTGNRVGLFST
jgi:steroid delta-isomerase-like uncharacterized protein